MHGLLRRIITGHFRVIFSPGLVYGIAAEDEIEVWGEGEFKVTRRGGNLAVRVFSEQPIRGICDRLIERVSSELGGRMDGEPKNVMAFTGPVSATFSAVEAVFEAFANRISSVVWEYWNVYDQEGNPLNWWARA